MLNKHKSTWILKARLIHRKQDLCTEISTDSKHKAKIKHAHAAQIKVHVSNASIILFQILAALFVMI